MTPVRIAVGMSGGVDSSVTALFLKSCIHTTADLHALLGSRLTGRKLSMPALYERIRSRTPWSSSLLHDDQKNHNNRVSLPVELVPVFMNNWSDSADGNGWCASTEADYGEAHAVAKSLELLAPLQHLPVINLSAIYADRCFEPMVAAYTAGHTLNVDVLCNREVKFGSFMDRVRTAPYCCEYIAMGHYACTLPLPLPPAALHSTGSFQSSPPAVALARPRTAGNDLNDQTVFLARVDPAALSRAVLPLGYLFERKEEVRAVAAQHAAHFNACGNSDAFAAWAKVANKQTSTGICFVGERSKRQELDRCGGASQLKQHTACGGRFASFLREYIPDEKAAAAHALSPTVFMDAQTREEIPSSNFSWGKGASSLCGVFPSYAFTLGQRLVSHHRKDNRSKGKVCSYYVASKVNHISPVAKAEGGTQPAALLREVRLVPKWDHPLLYSQTSHVNCVRWLLAPDRLCGSRRTLWCWCCTRHQEPLQLALLSWGASPPDSEECANAADELFSDAGHCTVRFTMPVRALTPGQLLVAYVPSSWLHTPPADPSVRPSLCAVEGEVMCVAASGWIAPTAAM